MKARAGATRRALIVGSIGLATALRSPNIARANVPNVCVLAAEQEVGPYYIDGALFRSDIVEDRPGLTLLLRLSVLDVHSCRRRCLRPILSGGPYVPRRPGLLSGGGPHSQNKTRRTRQTEDGIFTSQHGTSSMADLRLEGTRAASANLVVAVDPDATPQPVRTGR